MLAEYSQIQIQNGKPRHSAKPVHCTASRLFMCSLLVICQTGHAYTVLPRSITPCIFYDISYQAVVDLQYKLERDILASPFMSLIVLSAALDFLSTWLIWLAKVSFSSIVTPRIFGLLLYLKVLLSTSSVLSLSAIFFVEKMQNSDLSTLTFILHFLVQSVLP